MTSNNKTLLEILCDLEDYAKEHLDEDLFDIEEIEIELYDWIVNLGGLLQFSTGGDKERFDHITEVITMLKQLHQ